MSRTALIVIDMINTYDHPDAERLLASARRAVPAVGRLVARTGEQGLDVVYVNDNLGRWRSHVEEIVAIALRGRHPELVEPLRPGQDSLFVVKARHSIFYQTPLEYLLRSRDVGRVVLCGQVTEQCVLYSALDAHIRGLEVTVARDAVAHIDPELARAALTMMERNMQAHLEEADRIDLG